MPTKTDADAWIRQHFAEVWPVHLSGFARLLGQLRQSVGGDLDLVLILAVIADRTPPKQWISQLSQSGNLMRGDAARVRQEPINIQSIADFSGIPKETVRRKVGMLVAKGWVSRDPSGRLSTTRKAGRDLQSGTEASVAYLAALRSALGAA